MINHPTLNRIGASRIIIPSLEGGINQFDAVNQVNDNQVTDAKNVWINGDSLMTRPEFDEVVTYTNIENPSLLKFIGSAVTDVGGTVNKFSIYKLEAFYDENNPSSNTSLGLFILKTSCDGEISSQFFYYNQIDSNYSCSSTLLLNQNVSIFKGKAQSENGLGIYVFSTVTTTRVNSDTSYNDYFVFEVCCTDDTISLNQLFTQFVNGTPTVSKVYEPLIYINGKGNYYNYLPVTSSTETAVASPFYGENMIPSAVKMKFTADDISAFYQMPIKNIDDKKVTVSVDVSSFNMIFNQITDEVSYGLSLADAISKATDTLTFTFEEGSKTSNEKYAINNISTTSELNWKTDLAPYSCNRYFINGTSKNYTFIKVPIRGYFNRSAGTFRIEVFVDNVNSNNVIGEAWDSDTVDNDAATVAVTFNSNTLKKSRWHWLRLEYNLGVTNNIEVTCYKQNLENFEKLCESTTYTQFGGADGLSGGSRTFLASGNAYIWNDVEEPLYFSENNFNEVGNADEKITRLAKQGSYMIVFKEHSIYYVAYSSGTGVTAENVQSGSVVGVETTNAYFPCYLLNDAVGCTLPGSVQLCLNRLVWANKNGKVYTLVTTSNTSQKNVYEISSGIERKFLDENNNCLLDDKSIAINWKGHYLLVCGERAWIFNYNADSFRYVYSYSNNNSNSLSKKFTWWYWEVPETTDYYCSENDELITIDFGDTSIKTYKVDYFNPDSDCESVIQTKVLDFGYPDRYKKIEKIVFGVGNDKSAIINLTLMTDKGEISLTPKVVEGNRDSNRFSAQYGSVIRVIPSNRLVKRLGIRIVSNDVISIDNIMIDYKITKEVR